MSSMISTISDFLESASTTALAKKKDRINSLRRVYPCVNMVDLPIVAEINPDLADGPWIAGGAVLSWFKGEAVGHGDIDVFCRNDAQAQALITKLGGSSSDVKDFFEVNNNIVFRSSNAVTIRTHDKEDKSSDTSWTVQIITKRYFNTLQDVIDNFDITVCQIGTDGAEYVTGNQTVEHINKKELHFTEPHQPDIVKRLVKYWAYGYTPDVELVNKLSTNPDSDTKWTFNHSEEDYDNAFK